MADPFNDFILQFPSHGGEIGVVSGDPHQKMPVVFGMVLRVFQHAGIQHVDLQRGSTVQGIAFQKRLEFILVHRIAKNRRIKRDRMARPVRQHVQIVQPVAPAVFGFAAQHFPDGIGVGGRTVRIRPVGRTDRVGKELALCSSVGAGRHNVAVARPVVPAEHTRAIPAPGGPGLVPPRFVAPELHDAQGERVRLIVVAAVLGGAVFGHGLEHFVPLPVGPKRVRQLGQRADFFIKDQILDGEE